MIELIAAFVVLGILTALTFVVMSSVRDRAKEEDAMARLRGVAASQNLLFEARGYYTAGNSELAAIEGAYQYTADGAPVTDGSGRVSVAVTEVGGEYVVGLATRSSSELCYLMRMAEPMSSMQDARIVLGEDDPTACTGAVALTQTGQNW